MTAFPEDSFRELEETIVSCARMAREAQHGIRRMYKSDGSVLTETDMRISGIVEDRIRQLFPVTLRPGIFHTGGSFPSIYGRNLEKSGVCQPKFHWMFRPAIGQSFPN